MTKIKNKTKYKKAFTLIELLVVIAIIGILTSIVMVSTQGALDKSKFTSALTSASSVLPELATCADDGGTIYGPTDATKGGGQIICSASGHNVVWPDLTSSGGWTYDPSIVKAANTVIDSNSSIPTMTFILDNANSNYGSTKGKVTCSYATSACS